MSKTPLNEERLCHLIRRIVKEELQKATIPLTDPSLKVTGNTASSGKEESWAKIGSFKPDPNKAFRRVERPRALLGWSDSFPQKDTFTPAPFRPPL